MDSVRAHVLVSGHVQGVFFRSTTAEMARARGLAGSVRNLPDGRVEAAFQGPRHHVEEMIAFCRVGPPGARVTEIAVRYEALEPDAGSFAAGW